jgi:hypothetical protein
MMTVTFVMFTLELGRDSTPGEGGFGQSLGVLAHGGGQLLVGQKAADRRRQREWRGGHNPPGAGLLDRLGDGDTIGYDHWEAGGHRLDNGDAEVLVLRWEHEHL